jgi:hypothetical protein
MLFPSILYVVSIIFTTKPALMLIKKYLIKHKTIPLPKINIRKTIILAFRFT